MCTVSPSWVCLLRLGTAVLVSGLLALLGDGALGAERAVAVTVAQSGEAFLVDVIADVQVPVAIAWDVLTDFDHMTAILGNLTASRVVRRTGNTWIVRQTGVARFGLLSFAFESEREIRLEPMTRILAVSLSGNVKRMNSEATILPLAQGVQIRYHADIVPESALARIFGASFVRHEYAEQFSELVAEMIRRRGQLGFSDSADGRAQVVCLRGGYGGNDAVAGICEYPIVM
jgi:hypothetical protein